MRSAYLTTFWPSKFRDDAEQGPTEEAIPPAAKRVDPGYVLRGGFETIPTPAYRIHHNGRIVYAKGHCCGRRFGSAIRGFEVRVLPLEQ